jgi:hypothetical protein
MLMSFWNETKKAVNLSYLDVPFVTGINHQCRDWGFVLTACGKVNGRGLQIPENYLSLSLSLSLSLMCKLLEYLMIENMVLIARVTMVSELGLLYLIFPSFQFKQHLTLTLCNRSRVFLLFYGFALRTYCGAEKLREGKKPNFFSHLCLHQ